MLFAYEWRKALEAIPNINFYQDGVKALLVSDDNRRVTGILTGMGQEIMGQSVVLTNGTFLNGIIHIGEKQFGGGRVAEKPSIGLTEQLLTLGFESGRMKTGTPPRLDGRSLDYSQMEEQFGDENPGRFSFTNTPKLTNQKSCYITYTDSTIHDILKSGFDQSPMFTGRIKGIGPRYCPSIEDKINRFADKDRHQLFVEPEGWETAEVYLNGFSTSLPEAVQYKALTHIAGFRNVRMFRPGYAIEYDYFPPHQLRPSLETQKVENLFFAGQINGTTGYEEAACQGLLAGINAHQKVNQKNALVLKRSEAYIGVLIDDLINKGTDEPYRMFTSRAEYRILLRQDNADIRLTPMGYSIGLASDDRMFRVKQKTEAIDEIIQAFKKEKIEPSEINQYLTGRKTSDTLERSSLFSILSRPQTDLKSMSESLKKVRNILKDYEGETVEQAEIVMKYEGYIAREKLQVEKMNRLEETPIIKHFDYSSINSLSVEARQKLTRIRPETLGQASRISGVSPSDISVLMVYMGR
jgi:tRNA uridine 5-carboxymethylaminomethyl modification enzyme